ncbi:MAG TPA: NAD(P)-dependent oxidoreductase, partial [Burkholderiaceae bacterium]
MTALRVLVTGATGYIGARLLSHLRARGAHVTALGRRPAKDVENIVVDDFDKAKLAMLLTGYRCDAVLHLAAAGIKPDDRDANRLIAMNSVLPATIAALAAQCGARAMVVAGSCAEYEAQHATEALNEDAPLCTTKLYGATKAAGTLLALARAADLQLPLAVIRLFNIYGPGEAPHRLLPSLVTRLAKGEAVPLSAGTQQRDFVHVDDACTALLAAMDALLDGSMPSGVYNGCTGQSHTVADFARQTARVMQADEALLQFGALPMRPDDSACLVGDGARLRAACGW